MVRKILHLDLDAFFCAVEEIANPELIGKPFVVGGQPDERGVVASCSYAARRFGIHSAMPMARAVRLCPELTIISNHHRDYSNASRAVMKRLKNLTLLVEQLSIDEAFMDVSSQLEDGETIARRLQSTIRDELGLPSSLGVATNKLVAKIANNFGKASHTGDGPPFAITVVPPGREADFLAPLSAQELWGVGPKTAERLAEMGVHTIGDLARYPVADLTRRFGKHGYDMARRACGIDESPVVIEHETKSVSAERTFVKDITARTTLHQKIIEVTGHTVRRLRRERLKGRTVHIKLRWEDFTTITRQTTLPRPTDNAEEISGVAIRLFDENWEQGTPVRLVGVGVSGFDVVTQLGLWDQQEEDSGPLKETLAEIERRFGRGVVRRADELDG